MKHTRQRFRRFSYLVGQAFTSSFFDSSARLDLVLRDQVNALARRLQRASRLKEISGRLPQHVSLPEFVQDTAEDRSHNLSGASLHNGFDELPDALFWVIQHHRREIEQYLGRNFYHGRASAWRNLSLPAELVGFDVYSNIWHQDNGDGNRLLHVFVFPQEITESDGPFEMVPATDVSTIFVTNFKSRNDVYTPGMAREMPLAVKMTGPKGGYLIMNPAISVHRAGIPSRSRDIVNVTLYPEWMGKVARRKQLSRFPG